MYSVVSASASRKSGLLIALAQDFIENYPASEKQWRENRKEREQRYKF